MPVLGIDIGGTKIAAGLVDEQARVLATQTVLTRAAEGVAASLAQVDAAIEALLPGSGATAIGICAPGPLNPITGVVLNPPNLYGWHNVPLAARIAERYRLPCRVENDANAAGLAEYRFGAAQGCSSVLYATLSTGIGAGIVLDGRIYHGKNGAAAEGGHVSIDYRSPHVCNCGTRGCIEALASGPAMGQRAEALLERYPGSILRAPVTAAAIGDGVRAGDELALRILAETAEMLSAWLGSLISLLDPDIIVIGGGVAQIGDPLFSLLRALTPARTINQFANQTPIVPAALAANVGILGAATVVMDMGS